MSEPYIPHARDSVVAYFGRNHAGNLRCYCVRCNDDSPLTGVRTGEDASKVYGDVNQPGPLAHGRGSYGEDDTCDQCEVCWVSLLELSMRCQLEHDEQQIRFARGPCTYVVEMGMVGAIRCRVY